MIAMAAAQDCYVTMDGDHTTARSNCNAAPRNDMNSPTSMQGDATHVVAGARCCSSNLNLGEASSCTTNCEVFDFYEARDLCLAMGPTWDLCTTDELAQGRGVGSGCKYDSMHVWTATECTPPPTVCSENADFYQDPALNHVLVMEGESLVSDTTNFRWEVNTDWPGYTGNAYVYYNGQSNSIVPKYRLVKGVQIARAGLHRFLCRGYVDSDDFTVKNDFWLRFKGPTVAALFGTRDLADQSASARKHAWENHLEPDGTNTYPYVSGGDDRNDGFLKIYNPNQDTRVWNWLSKTSDFDARDVYLEVTAPGKITMQIASRSKYAIDRCVIYPVEDTLNSSELYDLQTYATDLTLPETACP